MLRCFLLFLISLWAVSTSAITVVVNDPPSDSTPPCLSQCLRSYAQYAPAHGSNCEPSDNNCVCRDPLLAVFVACCMSDSCSADAPAGAAYLDFQCKMSGVLLPDLTDCSAAKKAQQRGGVSTVDVTLYSTESNGMLRSVMLAGPSTDSGAVVATTTDKKESTISPAASNPKTSQPVASTTSTATSLKTTTTGTSSAQVTAPPSTESVGMSSQLRTSAQSIPPPAVVNPEPSSSVAFPTAGTHASDTQTAKPITLGLSIGLGVPLSIAAVGILSFILHRRRKQQAFESDSFFMGGPYTSPGQGQLETTYATEWKPEMPGGSGGYAAQRAGVGHWDSGRIEMPS